MKKADEIMRLLETEGLNAPDMTQGLKNIGGSMQNGIKMVAKYFQEDGIQIGRHQGEQTGFIKGSAVTLVVTGIVSAGLYLHKKHSEKKEKKDHEMEGERILHAIKSTIPTEEAQQSLEPRTTETNSTYVEEEKDE